MPLSKLVSITDTIAKGDFSKTVEIKSRDELGQLANAFNAMIENLQQTLVSRDELIKEIEERKRVEKALQQSDNYLKTIFNFVQTGVMIIDAETHQIVDVNPIVSKVFGAPKEQIIGMLCHKFICPAEEGKCPITDLHQEIDNSERNLVMANGERLPVLKTVVPIILNNKQFLLESFVDITERKKAEEQQKRLMKDLEETNKIMVNRELRMVELKEEINKLCEELGRTRPYV
jgi:PAS domain S-box-containing protein